MPHSLIHALNIGTLSTWLSVAGFGTVGIIVQPWHGMDAPAAKVEETTVIENDFLLGDEASPAPMGKAPDAKQAPAIPAETLPAPPELPPLAESVPLPEIPDLPDAPAPAVKPTAENPRETRGRPQVETRARTSQARSGGASGGNPSTGRETGSGGGSGMSSASRLAAGRMPAPSYPSEARRKGQTGTVVVEFTVDASGRVISAYAKSPSPWPSLNNEAVRTVRRWRFPPGGIMKLQRPIVFQLR